MVLVTLFTPKPILSLIAKFHEAYRDTPEVASGTPARMIESIKTVPTFFKAAYEVQEESGKKYYVAYLWANVLGGVCFINHIYSENAKARRLLMADLEAWCRKHYVFQIGGMRKINRNTKAFGRWMKIQGWRPTQVLYMKVLSSEGDNGRKRTA